MKITLKTTTKQTNPFSIFKKVEITPEKQKNVKGGDDVDPIIIDDMLDG